jgi:hypothetical protein
LGEIGENKRIYPVGAGTATTGRIRDTSYGGAGSCHHKIEEEIYPMGEQVATTIGRREIHRIGEQSAITIKGGIHLMGE